MCIRDSMNTVLDDNKKLCLNSGQILILTPHMTMMFEVEDLAVASPATVSRCGMVYMEPGALGLEPLIDSWLETLPEKFRQKKTFVPNLQKLFNGYLEPSLEFMRRNCKETVTTANNNLTQSLMRLISCFFIEYYDTEVKRVTPEEIDVLESMLEPIFLFALTWSVGCTVDSEGRKKFNHFLLSRIQEQGGRTTYPEGGTIYDFLFNKKTKSHVPWAEPGRVIEVDQTLSYSEIVIPTNDYTRMLFLMKTLLTNNSHVLCTGPTGTGKSLNAMALLTTGLTEEWQSINITFSAQTSANQTQDTIDSVSYTHLTLPTIYSV
eukprot:TRINITY_DN17806_c0_g1_i1.p1 TRINITY_DN17806_c0_g1~~TRINITY_DN17806_c0_g1_i1.p1  ORF type:complete len:339 (-),score=77.25 TRINITY_DN17806_c0_g1_i1:34-993(-)